MPRISRRTRTEDEVVTSRPAPTRGRRDYGPPDDDDDVQDIVDQDAERVSVDEAAVGGPGWATADEYRKATRSGGVDRISIAENEVVVGAFMDEGPFSTYIQRWVAQANRSFVALQEDDPLEAIGVEGKTYSAFNFVPITSSVEEKSQEYSPMSVWVLQASPSLADALRPDSKGKGSAAKPINASGRFYEIKYAIKPNGFGAYTVTTINASELTEYWEVEPPSEDDLIALEDQLFSRDDYPSLPTRAEVEAAADKIMSADRPGSRRGR